MACVCVCVRVRTQLLASPNRQMTEPSQKLQHNAQSIALGKANAHVGTHLRAQQQARIDRGKVEAGGGRLGGRTADSRTDRSSPKSLVIRAAAGEQLLLTHINSSNLSLSFNLSSGSLHF